MTRGQWTGNAFIVPDSLTPAFHCVYRQVHASLWGSQIIIRSQALHHFHWSTGVLKNVVRHVVNVVLSSPSGLFALPLPCQSGSKVRDRTQTHKGWTPPSFKETEIEITIRSGFSFDLIITRLPSSDLTTTGCSKENILSRVVPLPASWERCTQSLAECLRNLNFPV